MEISEIEKMLYINKHRLDEELDVQSEVQWRIAEQMAKAGRDVAEIKESLAQIEAQVAARFPELSVAKVQDQVRMDRDRIAETKRYQSAVHTHNLWIGLHGAWIARGYNLKALCDLYASNYFSVDSHTVRERGVQEARDALNRERHRGRAQASHTQPPTEDPPIRRRSLTS